MTKAVFLDIDGTLLSFTTRQVPKSAFDAMYKAKEKGVKLFIATGRHKKELGTDPHLLSFPFDGYVTQNGAYCYTNEVIVHSCPMQNRTMEAVVDLLRKEPLTFVFCEENEMFLNNISDTVIGLLNKFKLPIPPVSDIARALVSDIYQIVPIIPKESEHLLYTLPGAKVTKWYDGGYDIVNEKVNKWTGIEKMIAHYGILSSETTAIGDAENDIEMLQNAGFSIAMGNASDEIKKNAQYVTAHVDEDGIANAFAHLFRGIDRVP